MLINVINYTPGGSITVNNAINRFDSTTRRVIQALDSQPRATVGWVAQALGIARGTVQNRMAQLFASGTLRPPSASVRPESLGYSIRAIVTSEVDQELFDQAVSSLSGIPEVLECAATSGNQDLNLVIVARDAEHLYDLGQRVLRCPGIRRTSTTIVLRELIPYRMAQLL